MSICQKSKAAESDKFYVRIHFRFILLLSTFCSIVDHLSHAPFFSVGTYNNQSEREEQGPSSLRPRGVTFARDLHTQTDKKRSRYIRKHIYVIR